MKNLAALFFKKISKLRKKSGIIYPDWKLKDVLNHRLGDENFSNKNAQIGL